MPTTEYDALLDLDRRAPGADRDEIHDPRATPIAPDADAVDDCLDDALAGPRRTSTTGSCGQGGSPRPSTIIR